MLTVGGKPISTAKFRVVGVRLRVRVTVRLFAALRERAGTGKRELELPDGATAGDVFAALAHRRRAERPLLRRQPRVRRARRRAAATATRSR